MIIGAFQINFGCSGQSSRPVFWLRIVVSAVRAAKGGVDFDGIFEILRDMDFVNKQLAPDASKAGGDNIICVSYFSFPQKMKK